MRLNYKKLGKYIQQVSIKNKDLEVGNLLGVSITKEFIPSIANTIGTDMSKYKIVEKGQFAYGPVTSRNGDKISVALLEDENAIVSTSYTVFEVIDTDELMPEYLMMWFRREEFDRYARYMSHGSTREVFGWDEMCDVELPIPSPDKQKEIVKEYHTITDRIKLNESLNQKLEDTAQTIYKEWFVNFEFPNENGKPYKSNGGEMVYCDELDIEIPKGWKYTKLKDYINVNSGYAFKSKWWTDSGEPVIKIGSIQNDTICESGLEFISENENFNKENYKVTSGDIVIAMTGFTMGKIGLIPNTSNYFYVNQRVGFFKLNDINYHQIGFLYCTLKTQDFQNSIWSFGGDSRQFNISNEDIESIKIILPTTKVVIEKYNTMVQCLFNTIIVQQSLNKSLNKLLNILLSKMATIED